MNQTTKPAPLGRGLSALFGDKDTSYQMKSSVPGEPAALRGGAMEVFLGLLEPGPYQPRRVFDDEALKELAESMRVRGVIQPLLVRPAKGVQGRYEIIAGERRWRAAQLAGLHDVPVVVRDLSDNEVLEHALIENIQRQDLSPLEEAEGYKRLMQDFQHTQDSLAKILGKTRGHIANLTRLLALPPAVRQMIDEGKLSAGHARVLVTAKDPLRLALEIIRQGMTVRQAEALARREIENPQARKRKAVRDADTVMLERDLGRATGLKVTIVPKGGAGTVTLHYKNNEQFSAIILKKLMG